MRTSQREGFNRRLETFCKPAKMAICHNSLQFMINYPKINYTNLLSWPWWSRGGGLDPIVTDFEQGRQTRQNSGGGCRFDKGGVTNFFNFYAIKI